MGPRTSFRHAFSTIVASLCLLLAACGGSSSPNPPPSSLQLTLGSSMVIAPQDGTQGTVTATVTGATGSVQLTAASLPSSLTAAASSVSPSGSATITFTANPSVAAGTYTVQINAVSGSQNATQSLTVVVAVSASVSSTVNTAKGINGNLQEFMSTSFQPAEWNYQYFTNHASVEPAQLNMLGAQHIRIQGVSQAVPMVSNTGTAADWDFSKLDAIVQPLLNNGDESPEFQIAVAPGWMLNAQGQLDIANHLNDFVAYSTNLVRYYNKGGFTWGGTHFQSASSHPITWWGIFNEYNINGLTAAQYVQLYNAVVPAILAVDPAIQLSALELSDFDSGQGDPRNNLPTFFAAASAGGVNAPVNVASTHLYSTCNQSDSDTKVFASVPNFANDVSYFHTQTVLRPDLGPIAVWVTENNVNADFADSNGNSVCNPGQKFVTDKRGTSAFFAAWRPYVFSQLGQAGNQGLYHWDYDADAQYSEVDFTTGNKYLSYWVDASLAAAFPWTGSGSAPQILDLAQTENATVEMLATKNSDGSAVIMIADRAVHSSSDNNGAGDPRTILVDTTQLGTFSSVAQVTIDANTNLTTGPAPVSITYAPKLSVTLAGYGVTYLLLQP